MKRNDNWRLSVEDLFHRAAIAPPEQRDAMLRASGVGESVQREVRALLGGVETNDGLTHRLSNLSQCFAAILRGPPLDDEAPEHLGKYEVLDVLGRGGMGRVYLARNPDSQALVAIKVLVKGDEARFDREARVLGRLHHENVARIYDYSQDVEGRPLLVMERVEGTRVDLYCARRPLRERVELLIQLCRAVHHAHQRQVLHRDLKPSNVMVTAEGQVKVLDFGISRLIGDDDRSDSAIGWTGTPPYMSPEQRRGEPVDVRSDLYSIGALAYEILGGHRLLPSMRSTSSATDPGDPSLVRLEPSPLRVRNRDCPRDLADLIHRCLALEPDDRPPSAESLAGDLQRILDARPVDGYGGIGYRVGLLVRRRWPWLVSAVVIGVLGVVGLMERERHQQRVLESGRRSRAALTFLQFIVRGGNGAFYRADQTLGEVIDRAAEAIDATYPDDPGVQAELHALVSSLYRDLARTDRELIHAQRVLALQEHVAATNDERTAATVRVAYALAHCEQLPEALQMLNDLALRQPLVEGVTPSNMQVAGEILRAELLARLYEPDQARQIVRRLRRHDMPDPDTATRILLLEASLFEDEGNERAAVERVKEAREVMRGARRATDPRLLLVADIAEAVAIRYSRTSEALAITERVVARTANWCGTNSLLHYKAMVYQAQCLVRLGRTGEALDAATRASEGLAAALGRDHTTYIRHRLPLVSALIQARELDRAKQELDALRQACLRDLRESHPLALQLTEQLAHVATLQGDADGARRFLSWMRTASSAHQSLRPLARCTESVARVALFEGDIPGARRLFEQAARLFDQTDSAERVDRIRLDGYLAACHLVTGDLETAERMLRETIIALRPLTLISDMGEIDATQFLVETLGQKGKHAEALTALDELIARLPADPAWEVQRLRCDVARLRPLFHLGRSLESEALADELMDALEEAERYSDLASLAVHEGLVAYYGQRLDAMRLADILPETQRLQRVFRGPDHISVERTELVRFVTDLALNRPTAGESWLRDYLAKDRPRTILDLQFAYHSLEKTLRDERRFAEALAVYDDHLLALYPDTDPEPDPVGWRGFLLARRAQCLAELGRLDEARAQLDDVDDRVARGVDKIFNVAKARVDADAAIRAATGRSEASDG